MKLPISRRLTPKIPTPHDDGEIDITIHVHHHEILARDVSPLTEVFAPSNDNACREFFRSIRGRVQLVPEEDARPLFHYGTPGIELHRYLRAVHAAVPLWPWLISPSDPWVILLSWANTGGSVWHSNRRTGRVGCAFPRTRLHAFLEGTRSRLAHAARAAELEDAEWREVAIGLGEQVLPHATDARRLRLLE